MSEPEAAPANADPNKNDPNADLYKSKRSKKVVRLLTVVAYMFSVSFVAIVLSAYYLFLWVPPDPRLLRRPVHLAGDPELQFFIGDEPPLPTEAPDSDKLTGRVVNKRHESLNESLLILKMYLMDQQRRASSNKQRRESETEGSLNVENSGIVFGNYSNDQVPGRLHIPATSPRRDSMGVEIWPTKDAGNPRSNVFRGVEESLHRENASRHRMLANRPNPPFLAIANLAMESTETQLEKVTVRSVSNESRPTEEPEVASTTTASNRTVSSPKNFSTVLTTTATSSSGPTKPTPWDFTTNPNTETRQSLLTTNESRRDD